MSTLVRQGLFLFLVLYRYYSILPADRVPHLLQQVSKDHIHGAVFILSPYITWVAVQRYSNGIFFRGLTWSGLALRHARLDLGDALVYGLLKRLPMVFKPMGAGRVRIPVVLV